MNHDGVVAVVDYGAGNLGNARRAIEELGLPQVLVRSAADLPPRGPIVLPGVGNYGTAMRHLAAGSLAERLPREIAAGRRVVGICLGLQLLFGQSDEAPGVAGLGAIRGRVRQLRAGGRPIPHLGWSPVGRHQTPVYFAHSFVVEPEDPSVIAETATWGETFPAVIRQGEIVGFQFHPERSGDPGLEILHRSLTGRELPL